MRTRFGEAFELIHQHTGGYISGRHFHFSNHSYAADHQYIRIPPQDVSILRWDAVSFHYHLISRICWNTYHGFTNFTRFQNICHHHKSPGSVCWFMLSLI